MRVLLIFPKVKFLDKPGDRPPLGIVYLASYLRKYNANVEVSVIDFNLYPHLTREKELDLIASNKPDVVGISFLTPGYIDALEIAYGIKQQISTKIILVAGGPHASAASKETLEESAFDFVVRGEGEETFLELIQAISKGKNINLIKGLTYKQDRKVVNNPNRDFIKSLDSIPFPAHDLLEMHKYSMEIDGRLATSILSSRGCPYQCIYCSKKVFGSNFRERSAKNIVEEIKFIKKKYGTSAFLFVDDTFTIQQERVNDFCNLVKEEGLDIRWRCWTRPDCVDKKLLENMYSAGCRIVCFGIESGNQKVLDNVKKGLRVEENRNAIKWSKAVGLKVKLFVMVGLPGESEQDVDETINFVLDCDPDTVDCYITTPYPYTELWDNAGKFGVKIKSYDWKNYYYSGIKGNAPVLLNTDKLSEVDILMLHKKMRKKLKKYLTNF